MDKRTTHSGFESYAPRQRTIRPCPSAPPPKKKRGNKLLRNTMTCAIIALLVWGLSAIDTPFTNDISNNIEQVVNKNAEFDEIGKLKFVDSESVRTESSTMPIEGEVLTAFSQSGKDTVIKGLQGSDVYTILSGTVTKLEEQEITIKSEDGTKTTYQGIEPTIDKDDELSVSQSIGTLMGNELRIVMVKDGQYIDPLNIK